MTRIEARNKLLALMAELSEDYWCAGWLHNLEKDLQAVLDNGPEAHFGLSPLSQEEFKELKELRETAKGWWAWRDELLTVAFVPDSGTDEPGIAVTGRDF